MIKQLRKRHLQIWALWAVLIPVGIIVAWMAVPKKVTQELLQKENLRTAKKIIASIEKENYKINILLDSQIVLQGIRIDEKHKELIDAGYLHLEFTNKKELTTPSLLLYQINDSTTDIIDKQELLGRIQSKGSQYFPLKMQWNLLFGYGESYYKGKFVLYDIIKKQAIDSITINNSNVR